MHHLLVYRTAEELGMAEWEFAGLRALVGPLARGELEVDMREYGKPTERGVARCIGGWLAVLSGLDAEAYVTRYQRSGRALERLYYPRRYVDPCNSRVAAAATSNFLRIGDPLWDAFPDSSGSTAFLLTLAGLEISARVSASKTKHLP